MALEFPDSGAYLFSEDLLFVCPSSGIAMILESEKVISAASPGAKIPSETSCCMISRAWCWRSERVLPVGWVTGAFSLLFIVTCLSAVAPPDLFIYTKSVGHYTCRNTGSGKPSPATDNAHAERGRLSICFAGFRNLPDFVLQGKS